jgi:hypothetical protein
MLVAQLAIGILDSSLPLVGIWHLLVSAVISFLVCAAIFAHLAIRQSFKPFVHAWAVLTLQTFVGALLLLSLIHNMDGVAPMSVAMELVALVCALIAGTALGSSWRHRADQPAGA